MYFNERSIMWVPEVQMWQTSSISPPDNGTGDNLSAASQQISLINYSYMEKQDSHLKISASASLKTQNRKGSPAE